jgi:hypothetical protein
VTSATRRMRPPQRGHARTSIAKQRLRSSAHGRYRDPARFAGFSASAAGRGRSSAGVCSLRRSARVGLRTKASSHGFFPAAVHARRTPASHAFVRRYPFDESRS